MQEKGTHEMLIIHHNDADGRAAAAVVRKWALTQAQREDQTWYRPNAEGKLNFFETDYKTSLPLNLISKDDTVVIADFSYKPEQMQQVIAAAKAVVWCDHHKTAAAYGYELPGVRDFSDKGLSGCECTWKHFFPHEPMPEGLELLGDYDAWRLKHGDVAFGFYEGLKLQDTSPQAEVWELLLAGGPTDGIVDAGWTALRYRDMYCSEMRLAFAWETEVAGHRAVALNVQRFGSGAFGELFETTPVCVAYAHDGRRYTVSLYSKTVDVGAIAKGFGGGGHAGAAGFVCTELPFAPTEAPRAER